MPIYQYECSDCKTKVEMQKSVKDFDREEPCVQCKKPMKRLISQTSFALKGTGWARDGYFTPHVTFKNKDGSTTTTKYKRHLDKGEKV